MMDKDTDLKLEAAYLAGFQASGEGYNGEYPFGDHNRNPEHDPVWCKDRDNKITAIKQAIDNATPLAAQPAPDYTKDEALDKALEALEIANSLIDNYYIPKGKACLPEIEEALTAIKQALAAPVQPEQEPVTSINLFELVRSAFDAGNKNDFKALDNCEKQVEQFIATTPPAAPVQEPFEYWNAVEGWVKIDEVREHFDSVGCGTIYKTSGDGRVPLTAAPVRPWVGLTDEQINLFINGRGDEDDDDYVEPTGDGFGITDADLVKLVRRAEAELKKENT
jgi:hypothetical protein